MDSYSIRFTKSQNHLMNHIYKGKTNHPQLPNTASYKYMMNTNKIDDNESYKDD
jgi:hypothetical protein